MKTQKGKHRKSHWYLGLLVMLLSVAGLLAPAAMAQQATANVNGVVKDPSGASVAKAQVELTNVDTGVVRKTTSNTDGLYDFPSVVPGVYSMQASAAGFATVSQPAVTLQVGQTATFDFHLTVGATSSTVTVTAAAPTLEFSTSELGTVVSPAQVNDLPLNGRNFTELLTMLPGVSNINTDQNSGGGGGWNGASIGQFSFPAVNGARNRSNMFILDGSNDLNTLSGTYNYSPIIDAIQEFKSQGHNDLAEYGGAAGATVSVVTKGGTNQYHGDAWEFLRNQVMDAKAYFGKSVAPLRQNQYGASVGGPLSIPKVYNGKNRTFFFVAWEDYAYRSAVETGALGPTAAMRAGDFSGLCTSGFTAGICNDRDKTGTIVEDQLYDPATTATAGTGFSRAPFLNNQIPSGRISKISALYESVIPLSGNLVNGANLYVPARTDYDQQSGTIRVDQNFGNNNQAMFRYSQFDLFETTPTGTIGNSFIHVPGHNYIGHWTHTFSSTAFSDVYFARNYGYTYTGASHPGEDSNFLSQLKTLGMSPFFTVLNNTGYAPQYSASGYVGLTGSQLQASGLGDDWQFGGSFTKILGRHTIKAGADFVTNNFTSPIAYSNIGFSAQQTSSEGANPGNGGNSWASLLLGVPSSAGYRNIDEVVKDGWINGIYIQDQFKATSRLTLNLGFRNDMIYTPIYGTGNGGNYYTGNANPITGLYVLNALPPTCSANRGAPCIPDGIYTASSTPGTGLLPPSAIINPNLRVIKNSLFDWAPRFGLAYRLNNKTVIRAAFSRFFDEWADITQLSQNFGGNWPAVATDQNNGLNLNIPTVNAADPLQFGSGGSIIYPINDFSQVSQWMVDPNFKTPVFDQWNAGIQRELPANITLDANYVGSNGRHEDWGPVMNVPQPGPGDVQSRRPFPYMLQQWLDQSVGDSRYNALQVTVTERPTHGINFLAAYTLAQANADGCNLGASCESQNPYNRKGDYGTSDLNERHVFSVSFGAASPYDKSPNKLVSTVVGGWALNGILQITSGKPYTVTTGADAENVGCCNQQRANQVSNPSSSVPKNTSEIQWINPSAFAQPAAYTYGTGRPNSLTGQHWNNLDMNIARKFNMGLGEERYFEFRAEAFNLFNNVVFNPPNSTLNSPVDSFGNPTFGTITSQWNNPRVLQMSLKLYY